jgi:hypothetical protein
MNALKSITVTTIDKLYLSHLNLNLNLFTFHKS